MARRRKNILLNLVTSLSLLALLFFLCDSKISTNGYGCITANAKSKSAKLSKYVS